MTKYGSQFSGTDDLHRASGVVQNAAARLYKNYFDLTTEGGTAEALKIADVGFGCCIDEIRIETGANLSGVNFTIGTADDVDKYGTAVAGPNATTQIRYPLLALGLDVTTEREEIFLYPSGALGSTGAIRTTVVASHR